jgi:hypothetical protein
MSTASHINNNPALNHLLQKIKTVKGDNFYTHTSIEPPSKYSMQRNLIENFYDVYNHQIPNTLTEIPQHYSMLRFDFDIKGTEYADRFYTDGDIKFIIAKIQTQIKSVVDTDVCVDCCLFEKAVYLKKPEKNEWSGGFHLQFPHVFIENKSIFNRVIKPIQKEIKDETGIEFDDIYKNPWYMYGSCKSINLKPYILTKIYNVDMEEMTLLETFKNYDLYNTNEDRIEITSENVDKLLPRIFSINPANRNTQELKPELVFIDNDKVQNIKKKVNKNDDRNVEEKLVECKKLLSILSAARVDEYKDWMELGWCLYSIGNGCDEALDLWDEKSQDSSNYEIGCCEMHWAKMKVGNYKIATLHYWAKQDNPDEYKKLFGNKTWVKELVAMDFNDLYCAEKFKEYNNGEIFYTESHRWVIFDKNTKFWTFNNNEKSLVYCISKFFSTEIKKFQLEFMESYDPQNKDDVKLLKYLITKGIHVGMTKFANGVIGQLQSIMTENSSIMEKFDTNPALIAFKNGKVIDLANGGNSRDILKEDFIITHTGYDLPERNNNNIETMRQIVRGMVETDDDLKSLLSALSCFIYGQNINEKFFVFTGSGGNGKGVIDKSIMTVLGNYYKTINVNQLTTYEKDGNRANSELTSCQYARCVMTSEPDVGRRNKLITAIIKKWTGGDKLSTRDLNSKKFEFFVKFVLALQCNDIPELSALDGGTERRMRIIELFYEFVDDNGQELSERQKYKDVTLKETVGKPEMRNAMLFILVDTWLENKGIFYESAKIKEFTNEYFETQNPVKLWFESNYEINATSRLPSAVIFNDYKEMTIDNDMTLSQFGRYLKDLCKSNKSGGKICYHCKKVIVRNEMILDRLLG